MTARFAWLSVCLVAATAVALLLLALVFLPVAGWEAFVPVATVIGAVCVAAAAIAVDVVGKQVAGPLRQMVRRIDTGALGTATLRELAEQAPAEVAPLLYALHRTHGRLRSTMAELERDRAQVATLFEHMADGVLVLDGQERIALSNPAARRLLRQARLEGRALAEAARDAELIEVVRRARLQAEPVRHIVELRTEASGGRVWMQLVATRLPDDERTLLLVQDVTELRRAEAARRDFVANVSHELRTPVAALKALVETLESGALEDDPAVARDFLRRMHVEVDGLAHMVTELLELARVEAGRVELEVEACQAGDLLRAALDRVRPHAERTGLEVELIQGADLSVPVRADRRRIGQVLANLLANAAKFTPAGGRIEVGARATNGSVEFRVADSGVGIRPEHLDRVFERFYKTDVSRTGGGTGLGLAICKHLVLAHGGTIWAESAGEGQGATFCFTLERAQVAAPAEPESAMARG
jgi:two-component system, OmpR family, phosphate regulon sensor histidine kinase PhoR